MWLIKRFIVKMPIVRRRLVHKIAIDKMEKTFEISSNACGLHLSFKG